MFTVLVKNRKTGDEWLYACEYVKYLRSTTEDEEADPGLLIKYKDGSSDHLGLTKEEPFQFDAFVMNAAGKTVARYAL